MIGIWLITTSRRGGVVLGWAIFAVYSSAWFPISSMVGYVSPLTGAVMSWAIMAVPVLIGVFGLPRRPTYPQVADRAGPLASAAAVS